MLYFIVGKKRGEPELEVAWHVGDGLPRITRVDEIYADGHELQYLQRLGFAITAQSNVSFYGDRANDCLRAMREDKKKAHRPTGKPEWVRNAPINVWELSLPEQMVYTAAYGSEFQYGHGRRGGVVELARNALFTFWRHHGNPKFSFPQDDKSFTFADDDWGN
jgi:hypothetical protein